MDAAYFSIQATPLTGHDAVRKPTIAELRESHDETRWQFKLSGKSQHHLFEDRADKKLDDQQGDDR